MDRRTVLIAASAALLAAGGAALSQPQRSRRPLPPNVEAQRNIEYAKVAGRSLQLDLYLPKGAGKPTPLVIWIHGGGWRGGSRHRCPALPLTRFGFAVASISYRLSREAIWPAQIHDCKAAVRWLRANAEKYNLEPKRFGAWGSSAGGHLAAMLATAGDVEAMEGTVGVTGRSSRVQAACDWFGPTDFLKMNEQAGKGGRIDHDAPGSPESLLIGGPIQENKAKARSASPITYVSSDDPPLLIMHGDRDPLVPYAQSVDLHKALKAAGADATLHIVKGAGHGLGGRQVLRTVVDFFRKRLNPRRKTPARPPGAGHPLRPADNAKTYRNVEYARAGDKRLLLDLYVPGDAQAPVPVVVWIHGGAWRGGSKDQCPAAGLTRDGFAAASISYRLSQEAVFPAQIHDCKAAIRWLRANAEKYNLDGKRIGVWGSSAGGHLAALLGTSGAVKALEGKLGHAEQSSRVQAVCNWFGPTDFTTIGKQAGPHARFDHNAADSPEAKLIGGAIPDKPGAARAASPVTYVSKDDPPFLNMHGDRDPTIPVAQSKAFHEALKKAGVDSRLEIIEGAGHGFRDRRCTLRAYEFFRSRLAAPRTRPKRQ